MRKVSLAISLLFAFAGHATAQEILDCAALANSAAAEPPSYASQCDISTQAAPAAGPLAPYAPSDTAYSYNMRGVTGSAQGLYSFTLSTFGTQTFVGDPGASFYSWDFDPAALTLYAIQTPTTGASSFGTVNPATGTFTVLASVTGLTGSDTPTGLSIDPVTGEAFLSSLGNIYSFDLATGAATLIGPTGVPSGIMIDIAINCDGDMYGHDIGTDSLYSIDRATGAATLIGTHGLAANFAQGMDFDNNDGTLYAAVYTGGGTFTYGSFNLTTGAITPLHTNTPSGEWELAIPTTCGPVVPPMETEPNDDKASANVLQLPGSDRAGVMTGNSTSASGTGIDTFLVKTTAQAPGFYRHRLIVQSTPAGHTLSIRGLNQSASVIGTIDTAVQTSSTTTTPARFVQWYTNGTAADLYVRVTGTASTTSDYVLDYDIEPVTIVTGPIGLEPGELTVTTVGQTTEDTDLWIYDGARMPIPDFGNDDTPAPSTANQSTVTQDFDPGIYYVAVTNYNFANNLASPDNDRWRSGPVVDFPGILVNSSTSATVADVDTSIGGTPVTLTRAGAYDVQFARFQVGVYEIEGNDSKSTANTLLLPPADATGVYAGNSTSATGAGLDYVRVTTAPQATAGFYKHRLIVTSAIEGHTLTIRGLTQSAGVINTTSDATLQTSAATTTPARHIQWYTTEVPADLYIRVTGTVTTIDDYSLDYTVEPVVPTAGPDVATTSPITITTVGQTSTDTDMWVYTGSREAIPGYGNDDHFNGATLQSELIRPYAEGSYILAIANWQLANDQASPADDDYRSGTVLDFPGAIASSSTTLNLPLNPNIGGTAVPLIRANAFDVGFVTFSVEGGDTLFKDGFDEEAPIE